MKLPENFVNGEYLFGKENLSAALNNLYTLAGKSVAVLMPKMK
jgi:hypothetical protein